MMRGGEAAAAAAAAAAVDGLPLVNHLLQHSLRSLCSQQGHPQFWVYSIFWRILPRNYPPPKWDNEAGPFDRNKGNKRNWILVWEDGYCDFAACSKEWKEAWAQRRRKQVEGVKEEEEEEEQSVGGRGPLQPELFFKMSHDVYNYGEGLMGKIAAERSHKWIFKDPSGQENAPFLSSWQASADSYPRTWEAQFKAGIQTIAIIAVGEGLLQLGSTKKVVQDVDFVLMLQRKFSYLQSIPGVFAQTRSHINISTHQMEADMKATSHAVKLQQQLPGLKRAAADHHEEGPAIPLNLAAPLPPSMGVDVPSMYNSLQALLSKLPAVTPQASSRPAGPAAPSTSASVMLGCPPLIGGSSNSTEDLWPIGSQPRVPPSSSSSTSTSTAIPTLPIPPPSDEFESYHCLFGQSIS